MSVVITGAGLMSPYGIGAEAFATGVAAERPVLEGAARPMATVGPFDAKSVLGKGLRGVDRFGLLVLMAADEALKAAGEPKAEAMGIVLGTAFSGLGSIAGFFRERLSEGPRFVTASNFGNTVMNAAASQVGLRWGLTGLNSTVTSGFSGGAEAIGLAADLIRAGRSEVVLAGGADELAPETLAVLEALGVLADQQTAGFSPGEGAALFVLEREDAARERGARLLARVEGYATSYDPGALRGQSPNPHVAERAIRGALAAAGLRPEDVEAVVLSANGEAARDEAELAAVRAIFGPAMPLRDPKALYGEAMGASGAFASAVAVGMLGRGEARRVLVNAFGYSGHHASLLLASAGEALS